MNPEDLEWIDELSPMQQAMLFHTLMAPGSGVYVLQMSLRLTGRLDLAAFERAWRSLVARHAILRTAFFWEDLETPRQVVFRQVDLVLVHTSWRGLGVAEQQARLERFLGEDRARGFDPTVAPLLRLALFELGEDEHRLVWTQHHLVTDGWSQGLVLRELLATYAAAVAGGTPELPAAPAFHDYLAWLSRQDRGAAEVFWRRVLAGFSHPTFLAVRDGRVEEPDDGDARRRDLALAPAVGLALREVARRGRLTLSTLVQGAWALLLAQESGREDVVFGVTVAGRPPDLPGVESIVGPFLNTLPLRAAVAAEQRLHAWLAALQDNQVAARRHEHAPLVDVQRWSDLPAGVPLFDHILVFENLAPPQEAAGPVAGLRVVEEAASSLTSFPLNVLVLPGRELVLTLRWDGRRVAGPEAVRWLERLALLLSAFAAGGDPRLGELPRLLPGERHQLLCEWNDTARALRPGVTLHALVAEQAARTPDRVAVARDGEELTYGELARRAGELAGWLRRRGVAPEDRVGVCLERSPNLLVALLGILQADAAYVPLDPDWPAERRRQIAEAAGARIVLPAPPQADEWVSPLSGAGGPGAEGLAYVMFTSGSTGTPKGVMIPHAGIVNRLLWMPEAYGLTAEERLLQKTPLTFDVSVWELFVPLLVGARLVLARPGGHRDPSYLADLIARAEVTTLHFVPSLLHAFLEVPGLERLTSVRRVMASGEALSPELVRRFFARLPHAGLHNLYGPTEASIEVSAWRCPPEAPRAVVPIGRPIANLRLHVMDRDLRPVPIGVPGELLLGGAGLARGYLGRPELTAAAFVPDPCGGAPGARLYRSGDLTRFLPDGRVEYLGRIDFQVKIRGFRIEPGEIEAALLALDGVREALVVAQEESAAAGLRLVAYVAGAVGAETLRRSLLERLPAPLVPAVFVILPALPLTASGKVDRRALPAPEAPGGEAEHRAPRTPVEEVLAGLWAELLGRERVGTDDHFFHLGGHSLLATRVLARLHAAFGIELPLRALFEAPVLADLAARIDAALGADAGTPAPPLRAEPREGPLPLSFAQQRLWLLDRLEPGLPVYNVAVAVHLEGDLAVPRLAAAFAAVVCRHEILRTTFAEHAGAPVQRIAPPFIPDLPLVDLAGLPGLPGLSDRLARAEAGRPFDLETGPLLRAVLLRLGPREHRLLVTLHHIVTDGWSMGILVRELQAFQAGETLPELPVQFADYALWQRRWLAGTELERQLAWWRGQLAGSTGEGVLELPTDHPRPAVFRGHAVEHRFALDRGLSRRITELGRHAGATPAMVLAAALGALLARFSGHEVLLLGMPSANRHRIETEGLIGFFVNTLVLRVDVGRAATFLDLLDQVRETSLGAYAHQDLPFERLVDELRPERDLSRPPLVQVLLAVHNAPLPRLEAPGLRLTAETPPAERAKMDLAFAFATTAAGELAGTLQAVRDLWDTPTVVRLAGHFATLLAAATAAPEAPLAGLSPLTPEERQQVLFEWNDTAADRPPGLLHAGFLAQAAAQPEAPAVVGEGSVWTRGELAGRARRLASLLRRCGVDRGTPVGVWMERSPELIAGLFGILAAGGTYVPMDRSWPPARVEAVLAATGAPVLLASAATLPAVDRLRRRLPRLGDVVCPDLAAPEPPPESVDTAGVRALFDLVAERAVDRESAGGFVSRRTGLPFTTAEVDEYRDRVLALAAPWLRPEARVLEVGCGSGLILWEIAPRVARCVGLDPSERTQERNRAHAAREGLGHVELPVGFADEIGGRFAPGSFDLVLLASTAQFFPGLRYLETVVAQALALLAPGGVLLVADVLDARCEPAADLLALDEELFHELGQAQIHRRTEGFANELGARYDVLLQPGAGERARRTWTGWHVERSPAVHLPAVATPADVAYVIHTSGSTGTPKGIAVQHAPAVGLIDWVNRTFGVGPQDRLLFVTSPAFDLSVWDVFGTLAAGGTVQVAGEAALREPAELVRLLCSEPITLWDSAPAALQQLAPLFPAAAPRPLRLVLLSGDWIPVPLPDQVRAAFPGARVISLGGATEAAVWSNWYPVEVVDPRWPSLPYGRPIANARYHVLDAGMLPCPIGVPGELAIGGGCLAVGYAGRADLTAAAFVPDPFAAQPGARLYRTGDRVRFLRDGTLEILGRLDRRVKVRGHRIEPGEIEAALRRHPGVREAVVEVRDGRLVAWLVAAGETAAPDQKELRARLAAELPAYMLPSAFVLVAALPVTANGKLDRAALPSPAPGPGAGGEEPEGEEEEVLAGLWAELLGRARVGAGDHFFDLGGHSLLATRVLSRLRAAFGVEMPLRDLFAAPVLRDFAARVREARQTAGERPLPPLVPVPRDGRPLPLSFAQQRLWFLDRLEPGSPLYNVPVVLQITGPLAAAVLARCLGEIVSRHEVLRTTFTEQDGAPVQEVQPAVPFRLPLIDLAGLPGPSDRLDPSDPSDLPARQARVLAREEAGRPFDLGTGPLLRAVLLRLAAQEHVLLLTLHHIASDGWSLGVLVREVAALYPALAAGRPSPLPGLAVQYADFAVWQGSWLQGEVLAGEIAGWRRRLAGLPALLELPTDRPRPAVRDLRGAGRPVRLPAGLVRRAEALGRREGATLFMVLLAAFQLLLARQSGQEDVAVGTPVAGRNHLATEGLIGFFVNTLVLRGDLSAAPTFRALLGRVRETTLTAWRHQDVPFEKLVEELAPPRSRAHTPLFQVMLALQNLPVESVEIEGLRLRPVSPDRTVAKLDLTLSLAEHGGDLAGWIEHATSLFDAPTIDRLAGGFERLLAAGLDAPDEPALALPSWSPGERAQLLREWNDTRDAALLGGCVHREIAARAAQQPDAVAVEAGDDHLTFGGLLAGARRLAWRLRALGAGPDTVVGLCAGRSPAMILGLLAVLEAGAAWLPLDPDDPAERLAFLLGDAAARMLLVEEPFLGRVPAGGLPVVRLAARREDGGPPDEPPAGPPDKPPSADHLAYVLYTSGSTGRPKGVEIRHGALIHLTRALRATVYAGAAGALRVGVNASFAFDGSVKQIVQLAWGHTLHLLRREERLDPAALVATVGRRRLDVLDATPSQLRLLLAAGLGREHAAPAFVLVGGEAVDAELRDAALARPRTRFWNVYGPTECTVDTTAVAFAAGGPPSLLGRPLPNVRAYVVTAGGALAPLGAVGELQVGGAGLARGYRRRPELTAERFVPDPFGDAAGGRLYRTGDRVRRLPGGGLDFLGRIDHQVKLRGFRIEPGEIEAVLAGLDGVRAAVVAVREDRAGGDRRLVAWLAADPGTVPPPGALRRRLREHLPEHLVPAAFVVLDALPLTPSGKVDRGALPAPEDTAEEEGGKPPATPHEEALAGLWAELLGRRRVGSDEDFFHLGGHSLLAVRLMARIEQELGVRLPVSALFEAPTVAGLAALLAAGGAPARRTPLVRLHPGGAGRPLFLVHPVGGEVFPYVGLARRLGAGRPVYGLQAVVEEGPEPTLEELASRYLEVVRAQQPRGPYRLAGWSFGALLAYEMARQLASAGERPALLALLDPSPPVHPEPLDDTALLAGFAGDLVRLAGRPVPAGPEVLEGWEMDAAFGRLVALGRELGVLPPEMEELGLRGRFALYRRHVRAAHAYRPRPALQPALLVRADASLPPGATDPTAGWSAFVDADVRRVRADHYSLLREPALDELVAHLQAELARVEE